jgi:hypothetical protein
MGGASSATRTVQIIPSGSPRRRHGRFDGRGLARLLVFDEAEQANGLLVGGDVEPVYGLGEAQVGVHAGDHNPRVKGQYLDADQRQADLGVDHDASVEDQFEHIGQATGSRRAVH